MPAMFIGPAQDLSYLEPGPILWIGHAAMLVKQTCQ
jgi:hypothetical protein